MKSRALHLLVLLSLTTSLAAAGLLRRPRPLPAVAAGTQMHYADLAGDGAKDLLIANSDSLQVLENQPGLPFATPIVTTLTIAIGDTATGDLNEDGDLDVVAAVPGTDQIVVYFGNGDGTFGQGTIVATIDAPRSVATGDFNGDGNLDVAVAQSVGTSVALHLGNGNGGLGAAVITAIATSDKLTPGDFNGDGKSDLIARSNGTSLYIAGANGSFTSASVSTASGVYAIGDFNNDTKLDVAIADPASANDFVEIRLGNGDGTFTDGGRSPNVHAAASIVTTDIDGDFDLDLVAGGADGNVAVLLGNNSGTFALPQLWMTDVVSNVAAGDFDRDGTADIVTNGRSTTFEPSLSWIRGTGSATFNVDRAYLARPTLPVIPNLGLMGPIAADVSGDGKPDVVYRTAGDTPTTSAIAVMLNLGDGTLGPPITTTLPSVSMFDVTDFNGDSKMDIVAFAVQLPFSMRAYASNGDGTFAAPVQSSMPFGYPTRIVDLDGDHIGDFVHVTNDFHLYRGAADGTFALWTEVPNALPAQIGDLNGDGLPDLVGINDDRLAVSLNQGNGVFVTTSFPDGGGYEPIGALADLNGDGHLDLFYRQGEFGVTRFGNGDGTFEQPFLYELELPGTGSSFFVAADFDGDGNADVANHHTIFLGDGHGGFTVWTRGRMPGYAMDVADMDGNGSPDLLIAGNGGIGVTFTRVAADPEVPTALTLTYRPGPIGHGDLFSVTATLGTTLNVPAGTVSFSLNGKHLDTDNIQSGQAYGYMRVSRGTHTVTARYSGDGYHASSTASVQVTVVRMPPTLTVSTTASHYCVGSPVRVNDSLFPDGWGEVEPPSDTLIFRNGNVVLNAVRHPEDGNRYHLTGLVPGSYTLSVEFPGDDNYEAATSYVSFVVDAPITPQISAGSGVFASSNENYASVAPAGPEFTYVWSVTNGAIVSGQGTANIRYSAGASGTVTLAVTVSRDACTSSTEAVIPIHARAVGASMLYLVTPCRAVDTRESTIVLKNSTKDFALAGHCGIPADAQSVAANITVVQPNIPGWIAIYPRGSVWGGNSTLNYDSFVVRANNAILRLGTNGEVTVRNSESDLNLLIDVYGYFK